MCGIAGIWQLNRSQLDWQLIKKMSEKLYNRGPDDLGFAGWSNGTSVKNTKNPEILSHCQLLLTHRRLSILDLSQAGCQPMTTEDGRYTIIFNGEIYNYKEIRQELEALGYHFKSHSDTEVLLLAYAHWGTKVLNRLVGMFAFAILDTERRQLFLARDFFGIKPLYYFQNNNQFAFASEIKALLTISKEKPQANLQRLYDYLNSGLTDHGNETMFAGVHQIPAAHYLELSLDYPENSKLVRYWNIELNRYLPLSYKEATEQLRELFLDSIRLHLRSDVPVGAALSGGIDSSSIVSAMRYLEPNLEIHTFSYVADDSRINEEKWIDIVGKSAKTKVHKVQTTPEELIADMEQLLSYQDEPFGSTSIYAQYRVFRLAHENGIKVMLDGQGADELFAGYRPYLSMRLASLLRKKQYLKALQFIEQASKVPDHGLWRSLANSFLSHKLKYIIKKLIYQKTSNYWLNTNWFAKKGIEATYLWKGNNQDLLREQLYQTIVQTSVPMLLRYEDRNSMKFSIESRVPFLTPAITQFMLSLPEEYIIASNGTSKAIFRDAMRGIVPEAILNRQDKIGFATPEKNWLITLNPWVEKVLSSEVAAEIPALNQDAMQQEWNNVLQGKGQFNFRIWRWLNVIKWSEKNFIQYN